MTTTFVYLREVPPALDDVPPVVQDPPPVPPPGRHQRLGHSAQVGVATGVVGADLGLQGRPVASNQQHALHLGKYFFNKKVFRFHTNEIVRTVAISA